MDFNQYMTPEALEEHFNKNIFPMLRHFNIVGACMTLVSCNEGRLTNKAGVESEAAGKDILLDRESYQRNSEASVSGSDLFFFSKSFGYNNLDTKELVNLQQTLFDSGSCAKVICGLALAQLEKEGKINMKSQVSKYLRNFDTSLAPTLTLEDMLMRKQDTKSPEKKSIGDTNLPPIDPTSRASWDWSSEASRCAVHIIETVSGLDFNTYVNDHLLPKINLDLPQNDGEGDCYTYLYKNGKMLQMKTLDKKLKPDYGLICTSVQMKKILEAVVNHTKKSKKKSVRNGYELLPGFGHGFKAVKLWPGGLTLFVCISALEDNGNAIICVEPENKWAIWIGCNTCHDNKRSQQDPFRGEPLCYLILKEFISAFASSNTKSLKASNEWLYYPSLGRSDHIISLFCFHRAGGSASSVFQSWMSLLPEFVGVAAIALPGRGKRIAEKPYNDILQLAEEIGTKILSIVKHHKFAFYGDGMGALLAFEVARYLELNHGISPVVCFFSGSPSPTTFTTNKVTEGPDIDSPFNPLNSNFQMNAEAIQHFCQCGKLPQELQDNPLLARALLPSLKADLIMEARYSYRRCPYDSKKKSRYFWGNDESSLKKCESPRKKNSKCLKLDCPVTVFTKKVKEDDRDKVIEEWNGVTDSNISISVMEGDANVNNEHTREELCSKIASFIGEHLTSYSSWIDYAAR